MGYTDAERQFTENVNLVDATNDPLTWNLNAGLGNLAEALGQDLTVIKRELTVISERLRQLGPGRVRWDKRKRAKVP